MLFLMLGTDVTVYVIHDGGPSHKAGKTSEWFAAHPNFVPVPTPVHASWLNLVESFFHVFSIQCLQGAVFVPPAEVKGKTAQTEWIREAFVRHVSTYFEHYNRTARPYRWGKVKPQRRSRGMLGHAARTRTGWRYRRPRPVHFLHSE